MRYRFFDCVLDPGRRELTRAGMPVPVEPQVFDLLVLLIGARDRVVTKAEIVEAIWQGRAISDAAITTRMRSARIAVGDSGRSPRTIATRHRIGYRFVAPVEVEEPDTQDPAGQLPAALPGRGAQPPNARPSLAVLPFETIGGGHPDFALSDAIAHDLIAELSRLRLLTVFGRGTTFRFRGADATPEAVRAQLGARYCLTGTVDAVGDRVTVTVELVSTGDLGIVVSERFSGGLADIHGIRDRILHRLIAAFEPEISVFEARAARLHDPASLTAWSWHHLAIDHLYRFRPDDNARAIDAFRKALELDPDFARAHAGLSAAMWQASFMGYVEDTRDAAEAARAAADRALEIDPYDPLANVAKGRSFFLPDLGCELERSLPWLDRAIALMPSYAPAHYARGWALTMLGELDAAERSVRIAERLSPLDPLRYAFLTTRALIALSRDDPAAAAGFADQGAQAPGSHAISLAVAAAAHHMAGHAEEAAARARALGTAPGIADPARILRRYPFRDRSVVDRIVKALSELGL